jgi:hypothetical protein
MVEPVRQRFQHRQLPAWGYACDKKFVGGRTGGDDWELFFYPQGRSDIVGERHCWRVEPWVSCVTIAAERLGYDHRDGGAPPREPSLSIEQRRALVLLASIPHGIIEDLLVHTHEFDRGTIAGLVEAGLATARREILVTSDRSF